MSGEKNSVVETNSKTVSEFKVPPDPNSLLSRNTKRKRVKILEEEEYAEKVSSIIERDFFPELEKLKAQSQYIDATDNNDVPTMQVSSKESNTNLLYVLLLLSIWPKHKTH